MIADRSDSGAARRCAKSRAPGGGDRSVDGCQQARLAFTVQGSNEFEIPAGRRVNLHDPAIGSGTGPRAGSDQTVRSVEMGQLTDLGERDIVDHRAQGGDLGAEVGSSPAVTKALGASTLNTSVRRRAAF